MNAHTPHHPLPLDAAQPCNRVVLVVDDEASLRQLVCRIVRLHAPGVLTVQASNGNEALRKLHEIRQGFECDPLFIITDLKMPVMDGWELIEALKKDYQTRGLTRGIPVVVLSSTSGQKGLPLVGPSVHGDGMKYQPLLSVAKDSCAHPEKYDTGGSESLAAWIRYFVSRERSHPSTPPQPAQDEGG